MRNSIELWHQTVKAKRISFQWRGLTLILTLLPLLIPVSPGSAQGTSGNIELVGRALMGTIQAVAVERNIAYLGTGAGLLVLDVTDPANPKELSRMFLPVFVSDVVISGRRLFVTGGAELRIFDISDPAVLREEGVFRASTGYLGRIAVDGSLVYVTGILPSLRILDVSDPRQPRQVGQFSDRGATSSTCITIIGRIAYVGNGRRFHIIDVGDPTQPQAQGLLELPAYASAVEIAVAGDVAYVAAWVEGLRIINVSDPTHPREVGSIETAGTAYGVTLAGQYAYVAADRQLQVLDLSDPLAPREVGVLDLLFGTRITLRGNQAYVVARFSLMAIVDISDPTKPVQRGEFETSGSEWAVAVSDGMAYVASVNNGLRLVDVSDPSHPRERGAVGGFWANDVAVSGPFAYVAYVEYGTYTTGLLIFDVSDPDQPALRSRLELAPVTLGIALSGSLAYIASGRAGLRIVDVSDPANPQEVSSLDTPGSAFDVVVSGSVAYVADDQGGLRIIDVSDPGQPREVGFDTTAEYSQLALSDHLLYALGHDGLAIFDVSEPVRPRFVKYLANGDPFSLPFSVAVAGNLLVVGDFSRVRCFDVTDPAAPAEKGWYQTPSIVRGLALADGLIYVGAEGAGLLILAFTDVTVHATPTRPRP